VKEYAGEEELGVLPPLLDCVRFLMAFHSTTHKPKNIRKGYEKQRIE